MEQLTTENIKYMVAHTLPTKKVTKVKTALKNTATYQIGVDILGFPIYVQHTICEGDIKQSKFQPKPLKWTKVEGKIIKQH
jgi:uncharacterized protein YijF (DUF1287 family)